MGRQKWKNAFDPVSPNMNLENNMGQAYFRTINSRQEYRIFIINTIWKIKKMTCLSTGYIMELLNKKDLHSKLLVVVAITKVLAAVGIVS